MKPLRLKVILASALLGSVVHAGTLSITLSNGCNWLGDDIENSNAQLCVNYKADWIANTKCALLKADTNMASMTAAVSPTYVVSWTPSYSGETPGVDTNSDGSISVNVSYTLYSSIYGSSGIGSVKDSGNNTLASTVATVDAWTSLGTKTDSVSILPNGDGSWSAEVAVGNYALNATGNVITKIKLVGPSVAFPSNPPMLLQMPTVKLADKVASVLQPATRIAVKAPVTLKRKTRSNPSRPR